MSKFVLTAQLNLQAPKNTRQVINQMRGELSGLEVPVGVKGAAKATKEINSITAATEKASGAANRMGKSFGVALKRFAAFTLATRAVSLFTNTLGGAVEEAIDFQTQMVKISQVTGKSLKQLRGLSQEITKLSVSLGTSSKELLGATRILAQAGIQAGDLKIALAALAKTTLAATFDDINKTAEGAVAILAQFGKGVGSLERQLGAINAVAGQFAVESGDLIGAVRRFGGVFKAAGGSLEELLGLFTSVRATTRESAESIATGLRTILTRIQRPKTIGYLKELGVELTDLNGRFVGPMEAVKRLSEALAQVPAGDLRFVQIAEELGGFRQIGKVIPLLQQYEKAERARQVAVAGGGSLDKDAETAQQALARQIAKTREEFLALIRGIAETGTFQVMVKTTLSLASAFIKVADAVKPLIPLIAAFAAFKAAKAIGGFGAGVASAMTGVKGKHAGGMIHGFARGGAVPGQGNRDTVPAMLTPGEFVVRKSSAKKIGSDRLAQMNNNRYVRGGIIETSKFHTKRAKAHVSDPTHVTWTKQKKAAFEAGKHQAEPTDKLDFSTTHTPEYPELDKSKYGKPGLPKELYDQFFTGSKIAKGNAWESLLKAGATVGPNKLTGEMPRFGHKTALDGMWRGTRADAALTDESHAPKRKMGDKLFSDEISWGKKFKGSRLTKSKKNPDTLQPSKSYEVIAKEATKQQFNSAREPFPKALGGLIQRFAMVGIVNTNKVGAAILDPDKGMKPEEASIGLGDVRKYIGGGSGGDASIARKDLNKVYKGQKYKIYRQGLNKETSEKFRSALLSGAAKGLSDATGGLSADLGLGSASLTEDGEGEMKKYLGSRVIGQLYEAGVGILSSKGAFKDSPVSAPFDFPGGLSGKLSDNFNQLPGSWVDAKSSYNASSDMKKKIAEETADEYKRSGEYTKAIANHKSKLTKKASGGGISGSDTVPALLTPGEFVINKKSAQRIGHASLNRMNKHGVTGFAAGGPVKMQMGGMMGMGMMGGMDKLSMFTGVLTGLAATMQTLSDSSDKATDAQFQFAAASSAVTTGLARFTAYRMTFKAMDNYVGNWLKSTKDSEEAVTTLGDASTEAAKDIEGVSKSSSGGGGGAMPHLTAGQDTFANVEKKTALSLGGGGGYNVGGPALYGFDHQTDDPFSYGGSGGGGGGGAPKLSAKDRKAGLEGLNKSAPQVRYQFMADERKAEASDKEQEITQLKTKQEEQIKLRNDAAGKIDNDSIFREKEARKAKNNAAEQQQVKNFQMKTLEDKRTSEGQLHNENVTEIRRRKEIETNVTDTEKKAADTGVTLAGAEVDEQRVIAARTAAGGREGYAQGKMYEAEQAVTDKKSEITATRNAGLKGGAADPKEIARLNKQLEELEGTAKTSTDTHQKAHQEAEAYNTQVEELEGTTARARVENQAATVAHGEAVDKQKEAAVEGKTNAEVVGELTQKNRDLRSSREDDKDTIEELSAEYDRLGKTRKDMQMQEEHFSKTGSKAMEEKKKAQDALNKTTKKGKKATEQLIQTRASQARWEGKAQNAYEKSAKAKKTTVAIEKKKTKAALKANKANNKLVASSRAYGKQARLNTAGTYKMETALGTVEVALKEIPGSAEHAAEAINKMNEEMAAMEAGDGGGGGGDFFTKGGMGGKILGGAAKAFSIGMQGLGMLESGGAMAAQYVGQMAQRKETELRKAGDVSGSAKAAETGAMAQEFGDMLSIKSMFGFGSSMQERMGNVRNAAGMAASQTTVGVAEKSLLEANEGKISIDQLADKTGLALQQGMAEINKKTKSGVGMGEEEKKEAEAQMIKAVAPNVTKMATMATSFEHLQNKMKKFSDTPPHVQEQLMKLAVSAFKVSEAQKSMAKAMFDNLKVMSAFNAAGNSVDNFLSSMETGSSDLGRHIATIEASMSNMGMGEEGKKALDAAREQAIGMAGGKDTALGKATDRTFSRAAGVQDFMGSLQDRISNLDLASTDPSKAKEDLEAALTEGITDASIRTAISGAVQGMGDITGKDASELVAEIRAGLDPLAKGALDAAKAIMKHEQTIVALTKRRRQAELAYISAQQGAIDAQLEAGKIFEEFGGAKLTSEQQSEATLAKANLRLKDAGVSGLQTGSSADFGRVRKEIQDKLTSQIAQRQAGGFTGKEGVESERIKELNASLAEIGKAQKERINQIKEEIAIIDKKNAAEKSSIEALLAGDMNKFFEQQQAAGAAIALKSGDSALAGMFGAQALGAGFKSLEGQGLSASQMNRAATMTMQGAGIEDPRAAEILAGTDPEKRALQAEGRAMAGEMGATAQALANVAKMEVSAAQVTITGAQMKFENTMHSKGYQQDKAEGLGPQFVARGGSIYANRGIFVPRGTDTVPAMLTPGEFVVNRNAVQRGNNLQILRAMNSSGGQAPANPAAMSSGGQVGYYALGDIVKNMGSVFSEVLPGLSSSIGNFSSAVEKLTGFKFEVGVTQVPPITVNLAGGNILQQISTEVSKEIIKEVATEIGKYKVNQTGKLQKSEGVNPR